MVPVFYTPAMSVETKSFSPSADKPRLVVADWLAHKLRVQLMDFEPVTRDDLCLVHHSTYVNDIFTGRAKNGFGNTDPAVAQACLHTCGSMVAAALHALKHGGNACSPSSGFNRAGHDFGGGYCTFNGLALAAAKALAAGAKRVAIIDCDQHDGNGTTDILKRLPFGSRVKHFNMGAKRFKRVQPFYDWLEAAVTLSGDSCDLILYQAGAAPHVGGPLGGFLNESQLWKRDSIVFNIARDHKAPVAWNLAGGYQRDERGTIEPVLEIHRGTMIEAANNLSRTKRDEGATE